MSSCAREVTSEIEVPVITNYSDKPVMTIVLQILKDHESEKNQTKDGRETIMKEEITSAWRVISFFFVVFILPTIIISIPLYARYHIYNARTLTFTDGDVKSFHEDVSSFWCQGQRLISNGTFDSYLTEEAKIADERKVSRWSTAASLTAGETQQWSLHLIKGSRFSFSSCSRLPGGTLTVIQGEENFKKCSRKGRKARSPKPSTNERKGENVVPISPRLRTENSRNGLRDEDRNRVELWQMLYATSSVMEESSSFVETAYGDSKRLGTYEIDIDKNTYIKPKKKATMLRKNVNKIQLKNLNHNDSKGNQISLKSVSRAKREVASSLTKPWNDVNTIVDKDSDVYEKGADEVAESEFWSSNALREYPDDCEEDNVISITLPSFQDCSKRVSYFNPDSITWSFVVNSTSNYYFLLSSNNSRDVNQIDIKINLERSTYDVTEPLDKSSNSSECYFPFSFMKYEGVVVDFSEGRRNVSRLEDLQTYQMTAICQPRSLVYTVFIILVPFIIVLFAFR